MSLSAPLLYQTTPAGRALLTDLILLHLKARICLTPVPPLRGSTGGNEESLGRKLEKNCGQIRRRRGSGRTCIPLSGR